MSSTDSRVVEMKFDRNDFAKGVSDTMKQLQDLTNSLKMEGATRGLADVDAAAKKVNFSEMADNADKAGLRIRAMTIFVGTAIATLSHQVFLAGENMVKALTIAPVISGFQEYELMMGSIQTILANTARYGTTLPQVTSALDELNTYADKTIYDFGEMTKNIGLFTNAGIRVEDATKMIEGFSNVAAASGTNAEGAAAAAYQLSQALSAGTIRLMDWRSLQNVGMGNKNMQDGLIQIAGAMGTLTKAGVTAKGVQTDFNGSLEKGWLSAGVMSTYLKIMAGDLTDAQMKTLGLTDSQIKNFDAQQKMAEEAATKVRTFSQLVGTVKEAVGSGWTETFRNVFGDFNEATDLFTGLNNVISGVVSASANNRNAVLSDWKAMGGRTDIIIGIKAAWQALMDVLIPLKEAFREFFPKKTAEDLVHLSYLFEMFMRSLVPAPDTVEKISRTFEGLFAVVRIGWDLLKAGVQFILDLVGHFSSGSGQILDFTANVGDLAVHLEQFIEKGNIFGNFFDWLTPKIEAPVDAIKHLVGWIIDFFKAITSSEAANAIIQRIHDNLGQVSAAGDEVANIGQRIADIFGAIWYAIQPALDKIADFFKAIAKDVAKFIASISFNDLISGTGVAAFVLLVSKIRSTIDDFFHNTADEKPGIFDTITTSLNQLTDTLKTMQNTLKAAALLEIAAAIGVLTIAISVLSKIDPGSLTAASTAVGFMMGELVGSLILLDKMMKKTKAFKMDVLAFGLILIATSVDVLASAVAKIAGISWNDVSKGLTVIIALVGALIGAMYLMPDESTTLRSATAMIILANAVKILADSVKMISGLSWEDIGKGLTGVAALLTALGLFTRFARMNNADIGSGIGIILLATSIKILGSAMKDISGLDWVEIAKGMTGIAAGLIVMVGAFKLMPKDARNMTNAAALLVLSAALKVLASAIHDMADLSWNEIAKGVVSLGAGLVGMALALKMMPDSSILKAAALLVVAEAVKILGKAMESMGKMSWSDIAASLVELAGSLLILVVALNAMDVALPGAAALIVAAGGLVFLAKAMKTMGGMSWSDIAASLVLLGGALIELAVGLTAMIVALPGALALLAAGPGLVALAGALKLMGGLSWGDIGKGLVVMAGFFAVLAIGGALSPLILALGVALVVIAGAVALVGLAIENAGDGMNKLADALTKMSKIDSQGLHNVSDALQALIDKIPPLIAAVAQGMVDFAQVIVDNAGTFGKAAAAMIDQMVMVLGQKMPELVAAFVKGIDDSLTAIDNKMPDIVKKGGSIIVSFLQGIADNMAGVAQAGTNAAIAFMKSIGDHTGEMATAGFNMLIAVINGIADAIRKRGPELRDAAINLGQSLLDGLFAGSNDSKKQGSIISSMQNLAKKMITAMTGIVLTKSPSRVFMGIGKNIVEGLAIGINDNQDQVTNSVTNMGKTIVGLGTLISDQMGNDLTPTIAPVLDLTNIKKDSSQIGQMLQTAPINVDSAYASAKSASATITESDLAMLEAAAQGGDTFSFVQNNTSPKALSSAELYRQTNNQLSVAKGVLSNAN